MSIYDDETNQTDGIQALGDELTHEDAPPAQPVAETTDAATADGNEAKATSSKTAVPDGHQAPVEFAKTIGLKTPQQMYGYVKNNKALKEILVDRGEGVTPRYVIPVEKGKQWWADMQAKRTAKAETSTESPQVETSEMPVNA